MKVLGFGLQLLVNAGAGWAAWQLGAGMAKISPEAGWALVILIAYVAAYVTLRRPKREEQPE